VRLNDGHRDGGDELDRRIAKAKGQQRRASSASARSENRGWAIGIEFVGAILVSGLIGWGIDHYVLNSAPWAMILMLVLGFAAGTRRAMQTSAQFDTDLTNNDPTNDPR
jgi:ATP synthase protein I